MSMTDPVADMLTRIRNGQKSRLVNISVPHSKNKVNILNVLIEEGFIKAFDIKERLHNIQDIIVSLKYTNIGQPVIQKIVRVSKPGKRIYSSIKDLKGYHNNMGINILSTSKGVVSDRKARQLVVGGEVICKVF